MEIEMRHEARQVPSWLIFDVGQKMKKLLPIFLVALFCAGCVVQQMPLSESLQALVGTYNNDDVVDTRERIWLKTDGRSAYEIHHFNNGGYTERDEGRWEVDGAKVVLWTQNDQKKYVRVSFEIVDRGAAGLFLELDHDRSDKSANIPMFGGVYRRISQDAPNRPPEPKAAPVTSRAVLMQLERDLEEAKKAPNKAPEPTTTSVTPRAP